MAETKAKRESSSTEVEKPPAPKKRTQPRPPSQGCETKPSGPEFDLGCTD